MADKVQSIWKRYIGIGNNEINVLLNLSEQKLNEIDLEISKYILAFRKGYVSYFPGGAGQYGEPIIAFSEDEKKQNELQIIEKMKQKLYFGQNSKTDLNRSQKTLLDC